jgi:serine protease AprX
LLYQGAETMLTHPNNVTRALSRLVLGAALLALGTPAYAQNSKIDEVVQQAIKDGRNDFDVIVRYKNLKAHDRGKQRLQKLKAQLKRELRDQKSLAGKLNRIQLFEVLNDAELDHLSYDAPVTATQLLGTATQLLTNGGVSVDASGARDARSRYGVTGAGVTVAIIDSGVQPNPDVPATRIKAFVDFVNRLEMAYDDYGHGTHVAGIIAGAGIKEGKFTGVAPGANIVALKVLDSKGQGSTSNVLAALDWVRVNHRAYNIKVVNLSLGATPMGSYKSDLMATAAEILNFAGIAVVVSAGNTGPLAGTITTPAVDPYVITVGALDDNGTPLKTDDLMSTFSSRGRTLFDNLAKPDLVAPGRKMVSLRSPGSELDALYPDRQVTVLGALSPDYYRLSGTSMAAPIVSGTIALMFERNPTLTTSQVKKRLKSTVTPLSFGTTADRGAGLVNAYGAAASISTEKEFGASRVSDAFAKDMRKFVQGQPFVWRDLTFNGGVDSGGITWEGVTWENVRWDAVTWENVTWEGFTWEGVTWEGVTWETVTWQSTDQQSTGAQSGTGASWDPVD